MSDVLDGLNEYFNAYKKTSDYRDSSMLEVALRKKEFEEHILQQLIYLVERKNPLNSETPESDDCQNLGDPLTNDAQVGHRFHNSLDHGNQIDVKQHPKPFGEQFFMFLHNVLLSGGNYSFSTGSGETMGFPFRSSRGVRPPA